MNAPIMANLVGIAAVGAWMVAQTLPPARAVRLRNALLARRGTADDFDWGPDNAPATFRLENRPPSPVFADAVARLDLAGCGSDWERALRIAGYLAAHAQDLGPIRADLETTYTRIRAGHGYCADFIKIFLAFAHAAGLNSRQWAFSFDGFGGHGHTIVEIFDRSRGKWLFLDVYNNIHVCDAVTMQPLSALEFRDALIGGAREIKIEQNGPGRLGFPLQDKLLAYYQRGLQEWYLICGNAVFSYESRPLVHWASRISGSLGQVVATFLGEHPAIQLLGTPENEAKVQALVALGRRFRVALVALGVLVLLLAAQLGFYAVALRPGAGA